MNIQKQREIKNLPYRVRSTSLKSHRGILGSRGYGWNFVSVRGTLGLKSESEAHTGKAIPFVVLYISTEVLEI